MSRSVRLLGALLAVVLLTGSLTSPATAVVSARDDRSSTREVRAQAALQRVRSLLTGRHGQAPGQGRGPGEPTSSTVAPGDATLPLRDLAQHLDDLSPARREEAARLLARPTDGAGDPQGSGYDTAEATPVCSTVVCVHYVAKAGDRDTVAPADDDGNGVPDVVDEVLATFTHVDQTYRAAGYRAPRSDGTRGGNALPDVYLANIGRQGLYGYCTSDQPGTPSTTWAYCVVDNDFSHAEFPRHTPLQNLQVTAAHEYFHAVQFGYDYRADPWVMEATATWVEDEVYDSVNDNRQYLRFSPLTRPQTSFDQFSNSTGIQYGDWIFFRYLSERFPTSVAGLPTIVRDLWRTMDARGDGPHQYSIQAVDTVLRRRGSTLPGTFARFAAADSTPARAYREGSAYPSARPVSDVRIGSGHARLRPVRLTRDHLSSATLRYRPVAPMRGHHSLHLFLDLPARAHTSAVVITVLAGHRLRTLRVGLDKDGDANAAVNFTPGQVTWAQITLADAGTRYRCHRGTSFSCEGDSLDDDLAFRLSGKVTGG